MNNTQATFLSGGKTYAFHDVRAALGDQSYARLPYVARVLAENLLRNFGRPGVTEDLLCAFIDPDVAPDTVALPLQVPRVVVPDSSGIPVLMDLAALRSAVARRGGDPMRVNATVPMTFVVDHSLQVDVAAAPDAEECISYGLPAFRLDGRIVAGFQATAAGCSYYPFSGTTLGTLKRELEGYPGTKSAVHFGPDRPLPVALLRKLIQARIAEGKAKRRR